MYNWLTHIGESEFDLLLWSDVFLDEIPELHLQDRKYIEVNQSITSWSDIYRSACTMMSTYSGILSLYNKEVSKKIKKDIIDYAVEEKDYEIGRWWSLKQWVSTTCKVRNKNNPDNEVMYVRLYAHKNDDNFKNVLRMGYPIIMWHKTSWMIHNDIKADGVLDGTNFDNFYWWHAISTYWSIKWNDRMHVNTYPDGKHNKYEVKNWYKLLENNVYYRWCYAIFPAVDLAKKKKQKFVKVLSILTEMMKKNMYIDKEKVETLTKIQSLLWTLT